MTVVLLGKDPFQTPPKRGLAFQMVPGIISIKILTSLEFHGCTYVLPSELLQHHLAWPQVGAMESAHSFHGGR